MHANFLARSKHGVPKSFFAELKIEGKKKISCAICTEMDPGVLILKDFLSIFYFCAIYCILSLVTTLQIGLFFVH